ncbi:MAG: helix-turn-helix transcriptional regulator [Alphaproteobacteria bacterium]|nr:helix-turn-helix transcriptional regulator [Alphaproteobacteria bacterium]
MDLSKHFGAAVRRHRTLIRLSQEELADRAGKDRTYISGIERGRRNPTLDVLQSIADALGVDLDVLFATARDIALDEKDKG